MYCNDPYDPLWKIEKIYHVERTKYPHNLDNQDRLIRYNNSTYSYNANGDMIGRSDYKGCDFKSKKSVYDNTIIAYDVFGNLKQYGTVTYKIDPLNRRSHRLMNGVVTNQYAYNPEGKLIGELDKDGNLTKTFIYASKSHVPDYFVDNKNVKYKIVTDQLGSVRLVVNAQTGEIVEKMNHDEFGKVLTDSNPNYIPFGFAGGLYDSETKLVRFGARDYDSRIGRWTSKDPIRFDAHGENLYNYVENNSINLIDISGEDYQVCIRAMNGLPIIPHEYIKFSDGSTISYGPASGASGALGGSGHSSSNDSGGSCGKNNKTSQDQDDKMKKWAKEHEKDKYYFIGNNCFNFVSGAIDAGK